MTIRAIIGRAEAKAQGLKRYFTGVACKHGHVCERLTGCGHCVVCNLAKSTRIGETPAGRLALKKRTIKWRATDAGKESKKRQNVTQYQNRPDEYKANSRRRRAVKARAEGNYTKFDLHRILEQQGLSCYCGVSFLVVKSSIDHKTPLSRKGSNWPDNIQLLCMPCNDSKGTKTMEEWTTWRAAS